MSVVNVNQATQLYAAFLTQSIQRQNPALRNVPAVVVADPRTGQFISMSLPQLLSEVQRKTQIGINEAVKYNVSIGNQVV